MDDVNVAFIPKKVHHAPLDPSTIELSLYNLIRRYNETPTPEIAVLSLQYISQYVI